MNQLLEIQQDVRDLERSVLELTKRISDIYTSIDHLRTENTDVAVDFVKVKALSKKLPFSPHTLASKKIKKEVLVAYIKLLLTPIRMDSVKTNIQDRLVLIQWMMDQFRINRKLEELLYSVYAEPEDSLKESISSFVDEIKLFFAVDLLLVVNCAGEAEKSVYQYAARLLSVLNMDKQDILAASALVRATLTRSAKSLTREDLQSVLDISTSFSHYIDEELMERLLEGLRVVVVKVPEKEAIQFEWKGNELKNAPRIGWYEKGQLIAIYEREKKNLKYKAMKNADYVLERAKNSHAGYVFSFTMKGYHLAVSSHARDKSKNIRKWLESQIS